jgi:hypothetical protein
LQSPPASNSSAAMYRGVACRTKGNQVPLGIVAGLAAEFLVVNFQVGHRAARLASQPSRRNLLAELSVTTWDRASREEVFLGPLIRTVVIAAHSCKGKEPYGKVRNLGG